MAKKFYLSASLKILTQLTEKMQTGKNLYLLIKVK